MFSLSTAQRVMLKSGRSAQLVQQPKRLFQKYGGKEYKSGFERMVSDKLSWAGLQSIAGMGFVLWGFCNLGVFGLSQVMYKQNFDYYFAYTGNGKFLQPFKSMMASESLSNVVWTAPSLIIGGYLLNQRLGSMTTLKLFGLSLTAAYMTTCTMGPASACSKLNLRSWSTVRFDCIDTDKRRMVGADLLAGIVLYSLCFSYGLWIPGAAFAVIDLAYYGPMGIAMPATGAIAMLAMI